MKKFSAKLKNVPQKKFFSQDEFSVKDEENYFPNELTIKTIEEVENGIGLSRTYDTVEELMKDLMDDA